jgi:hypothetical protein
MQNVHDFNPDALAAELSWRRQSLGYRGADNTTVHHPLPRWRAHSSSRSRLVRRAK